jgi:hypothetical protein
MRSRLKLSLALLLTLGLRHAVVIPAELTAADMPPNLSPELKA